jgi:hypothetical protein
VCAMLERGSGVETARLLRRPRSPAVDVRSLGELTETERREIELEENLQRKDLTVLERSKMLVRLAETAQQIDLEQAQPCGESPRGQFSEQPGSRRRAAERIGVPEKTIREAQQHVEIKQYHALEAREKLERIPASDRQAAIALVSQPGVPPKSAIQLLGNLAAMPAHERERVVAERVGLPRSTIGHSLLKP